jgi:hypothetical protein
MSSYVLARHKEKQSNGNSSGKSSEHRKAKCNGNFYAHSRHR